MAGAVVGDHLAAAKRNGFPVGGDLVIYPQRQHAGAIPGGGGDVAIARLQINGIFCVGCDAATIMAADGRGTAGVVEVAVSEKEAGDVRPGRQTCRHVVHQLPVARPAAGIDQGRLMAEADQVNGRITRRR